LREKTFRLVAELDDALDRELLVDFVGNRTWRYTPSFPVG